MHERAADSPDQAVPDPSELRVETRPGETVVHLGVRPGRRPPPAPSAAVVTGRIHGAGPQGPLVTWEGAERPTVARVAFAAGELDWASHVGAEVALAFLDGDARRPLVLSLLHEPEAPAGPAEVPEVLRIASERELVIECGKARIHLRADGRLEIRGEHLISRAAGPNKIRGGSVQIN